MDRTSRRLGLATATSILLHLALILPWSWNRSDDRNQGAQVHIAATLRPGASETPAKPRPEGPKPRVERGKAGRPLLSAAESPLRIPTTQESPTPTEGAEATSAEEALAYVVQHAQPPEYPDAALREGREACVLAAVNVDGAGDIVSVEILASDLPGVFDQSVIESQKTARYAPARDKGGQPVTSRVLAVAEFVILPERRLDCALKYAPEARRLLGKTSP